MKNLPEFKALINRYETITIEEIKAVFALTEGTSIVLFDALEKLTGLGGRKCTLCKAVDDDCDLCAWIGRGRIVPPCVTQTYRNICQSSTPEELLNAYRNRAKFMREHLKKLNIEL